MSAAAWLPIASLDSTSDSVRDFINNNLEYVIAGVAILLGLLLILQAITQRHRANAAVSPDEHLHRSAATAAATAGSPRKRKREEKKQARQAEKERRAEEKRRQVALMKSPGQGEPERMATSAEREELGETAEFAVPTGFDDQSGRLEAERRLREGAAADRTGREEEIRREAEQRVKAQADARARQEAEDAAKRADEVSRREAEEKARHEADARLRAEADARVRREADELARRDAERSAAEEAARIRRDAEEHAWAVGKAAAEADDPAIARLEAAERRLVAEREARDQEIEQAYGRLNEIEARAADTERRASDAERMARSKAEEAVRERRLREVLDNISQAEQRAREAEQRATAAEQAISSVGREPPADVAPPETPEPEPEPESPEVVEPEIDDEDDADRSWLAGSAAAEASASGDDQGIDLNSVTFEQLRRLEMSVTQATRTLAFREREGGFTSIDQLDKIPGIPGGFLAQLKSRLRV